jgi:hypothetical protein
VVGDTEAVSEVIESPHGGWGVQYEMREFAAALCGGLRPEPPMQVVELHDNWHHDGCKDGDEERPERLKTPIEHVKRNEYKQIAKKDVAEHVKKMSTV